MPTPSPLPSSPGAPPGVPSAEGPVRRRPAAPAPGLARAALLVAGLGLLAVLPSPVAGQPAPPILDDLAADLLEVEEKLLALAGAIPADEWDWRPAPGIRSVAEVLKHVAYDNFYFPTAVGVDAPAPTGITADYATARAWGERPMERAQVLEALDASFFHLRAAMVHAGPRTLAGDVTIFGREMDRQELWLLATVHAHEHLGQLIAYARMRGVAPPWSAGG